MRKLFSSSVLSSAVKFGPLLALLSVIPFEQITAATAPSTTEPSRYSDSSYFADASRLAVPPQNIVDGLRLGSIPQDRQKFCARTQEDVSAPIKKFADVMESALREMRAKQAALVLRYGPLKNFPNDAMLEYDALVDRIADLNNKLGADEMGYSLGFRNPLGTFKTGLCWFHSRLQRSAIYLTRFKPELPKPSPKEAEKLIRSMIDMDRVVEIPGFHTIHEFMDAYTATAEKALNDWSLSPGQWPALADRIGDRLEERNSENVRHNLEALYHRWEQRHEILFVRFSLGEDPLSFASHSNLIFWAEPVLESRPDQSFPELTGYRFLVNDSNVPDGFQWVTYGFQSAKAPNDTLPISYLDFEGDLDRIRNAIRDYCR